MSDIYSQPAAVFTLETVASINRAFAEAVDIIGGPAKHQDLRLALAERMMSLARNGERDEQRLCSLSVLAVLGKAPGRDSRDASPRQPNNGG